MRELPCWKEWFWGFFVDGITALFEERNKEVEEMAKKVMKKVKEEVVKTNPQAFSY